MVDLKMVPVRARVSVGGLIAETPFVTSFNVNRSRGQISTFSATIKVHYGQLGNAVGGDVVIEAGPEGSINKIFTGICRSSNITPCRDDPAYILLTISGNDILSELQGKKITRRCKSSATTWVSITGVVRQGLKSGKLTYVPGDQNFFMDDLQTREQNPVTKTQSQSMPDESEVNHPKSAAEDRKVVITVVPAENIDGLGGA